MQNLKGKMIPDRLNDMLEQARMDVLKLVRDVRSTDEGLEAIYQAISDFLFAARAIIEVGYDAAQANIIDNMKLWWMPGSETDATSLYCHTPLISYVILFQPSCCILVEQHGAILGQYKRIEDAKAAATKHLREGIKDILGINNK